MAMFGKDKVLTLSILKGQGLMNIQSLVQLPKYKRFNIEPRYDAEIKEGG